jgi:hypothetical protein
MKFGLINILDDLACGSGAGSSLIFCAETTYVEMSAAIASAFSFV